MLGQPPENKSLISNVKVTRCQLCRDLLGPRRRAAARKVDHARKVILHYCGEVCEKKGLQRWDEKWNREMERRKSLLRSQI